MEKTRIYLDNCCYNRPYDDQNNLLVRIEAEAKLYIQSLISRLCRSIYMKTDTVLRCEGMQVLSERLGIIEAERFITIILREPFDYTKWRQNLFEDIPLDTFIDDAMQYRNSIESKNKS